MVVSPLLFARYGVAMTIELSPRLESALFDEAARRGTTPNLLAAAWIVAGLKQPLAEAPQSAVSAQTLYDVLKPHIDSLPPPSDEPRPEWLRADNSGEAFQKILEERRQQGGYDLDRCGSIGRPE